MTPELAVIARLESQAPVTAIVSDRIHELNLPQSPTLPAIRVQLVSDPTGYHLRGPSGASRARIQVDGYVSEVPATDDGDPGADLTALGNAIDNALSGKVFTASDGDGSVRVTGVMRMDRRKLREADELRQLRVLLDYVVWWKPLV